MPRAAISDAAAVSLPAPRECACAVKVGGLLYANLFPPDCRIFFPLPSATRASRLGRSSWRPPRLHVCALVRVSNVYCLRRPVPWRCRVSLALKGMSFPNYASNFKFGHTGGCRRGSKSKHFGFLMQHDCSFALQACCARPRHVSAVRRTRERENKL